MGADPRRFHRTSAARPGGKLRRCQRDPIQRVTARHVTAGSDADLLAAAIEEVIYRLDADGEIPVTVEVSRAADDGIDLMLGVVDASAVEIVGAASKAASLSGLSCARAAPGRWSCTVTVDV